MAGKRKSTPVPPAPPKQPQVSAAERELASRLLSRRRLMPFIQRMNPRYQAGWVHEDVCRRLEKFSDDVAAGLSPRLMILMPPRHGKSEIASRNFPAWHLGRHPDHEFIACSYNVGLAMTFSRKVKDTIDSDLYRTVFETRLNPNHQGAEEWSIDQHAGGYVAAGVGGGITGRGAHCLVIDDPIKNAEEADSADGREKIWDWYGSTAYTRLAPGGGVLIIQTWWHDDDLAGRLQKVMSDALKAAADDPQALDDIDMFEVVKYPAIAEEDEYLDEDTGAIERGAPPEHGRLLRRKGECLHRERYDEKKLARIKRAIPQRFWSALYQQNPVPDDGGYFTKEQFRRGPVPHVSHAQVYVAFDFAITEKKANDYTVGTVGLQDEDDMLHVAEVVRYKSADALFIVDSILNLSKRWYSPTLILGVEDGQIWKSLESLFRKRCRETRYYPSIVVLKPITDKMARARVLQGRMQQGMISFNSQGEWFDALRTELLRFPAGAHDDIVDSLAWMAQLVVGREPPRKAKPKAQKSWRDKHRSGITGTYMTA